MAENSKKSGRSRAYPAITIDEALDRINKINENLGVNGWFNRESIAVGMGYASLNGASARRVAALVHYGFLSRDKDQYTLSDLAKKYLLPVGDHDKEIAVREAALSPTLFSELYEALKGQVIPKQFVNRLIHEFGIQQKAAPDVDRIFKTTMETAGILRSNGVLSEDISSVTPQTPSPQLDQPAKDGIEQDDKNQTHNTSTPQGYLSVNLPSGLIVSYSQELASAFAFGAFGNQLKALDDAVAAHVSSNTKPSDDNSGEEV